jgi:general secretion pathway protein G
MDMRMKPRSGRRSLDCAKARSAAFTLIEMLITVAIVSVLMLVAVPAYEDSQRKSRVAQCQADLVMISQRLKKYEAFNYAFPDSLAVLGSVEPDPWGNDYQYLNLTNYTDKGKLATKGKGGAKAPKPRKDKNLKPMNSDFDLFSMGADGDYKENLSAQVSQDDCIRANDGVFIGLAKDY